MKSNCRATPSFSSQIFHFSSLTTGGLLCAYFPLAGVRAPVEIVRSTFSESFVKAFSPFILNTRMTFRQKGGGSLGGGGAGAPPPAPARQASLLCLAVYCNLVLWLKNNKY